MSDDNTTGTEIAEYRAPKAELVTGGSVQAIIPRSADEVFRLAKALAVSGLAPRDMQSPDKITYAIMAGAEIGLSPIQSLQSIAVINGRPTLWGDGVVALLRRDKFRIKEWIEGEGDTLTAFCEVTRPDTGEVIARTFGAEDAKKAGLWSKTGPWQQYPKRMLAARARAWACRDGAADVLKGFGVREEADDTPATPSAPAATGLKERLQGRGHVPAGGFSTANVEEAVAEAQSEPETVVEPEPESDANPSGMDWHRYADETEAALSAFTDPANLNAEWREVVASLTQLAAPEDIRQRLTHFKLSREKALTPKRKAAAAA